MSGLVKGAAGALALALLSGTAATAADFDAAKIFGAREMVRQASLSPDGKSIALVQPLAEAQAYGLFIAKVDADAPPKPVLLSTGHPDRLTDCGWISNTRLICNVYMTIERASGKLGYTRLLSVNADGSNLQVLSASTTRESYGLGAA